MPQRTKYYHANEVAELLGCDISEVYAKLKSGELKGFRTSKRWLIDMVQPSLEGKVLAQEPKTPMKRVCLPKLVNKAPSLEYIKDEQHQERLFELITSAKKAIYIASADLKNLYIQKQPIIEVFRELVRRHVYIRLVCSNPRERILTEILSDKFLSTSAYFRCTICPRNHMKVIIFDDELVYIGSANLTNAAIGGKGEDKRNFEAGLLTSDPSIVAIAMEHYIEVWGGTHCSSCQSSLCESSHNYKPQQ